ncbi:Uu.00g028260.m01.CDS01 [Anthostomella pinea]|uniref:Uu.00g028260.m01.CDS01 n=1 Tax=Anthostomella pinea TaxID=933095 RepID=A0AAI8V323_9PEZI|nr:Uu.00g028260.m01.CDS01 [Anthostomella pinea]
MADESLLLTNITIDRFNELLAQYNPLTASISSTKSVKPGQKTLLELDAFRYEDAVARFRSRTPQARMTHEDVKVLVDWKLRHGKFRPTLMKLVSSNDEATVADTIEKAMANYWPDRDASKALDAIAKLKGIGPATASLLLSVHDPDRVIFFSDEAFYWMCCGGRKSPIKYNAKEYQELNVAAQVLVKRLGVSATDIEKVAYVLMKEDSQATTSVMSETKPTKADSPKPPTKRKSTTAADTSSQAPVRRSKRGKAS